MSDMVCRKSMMRCQTPGMCSPHGGCRDEVTTAKDRQISALIAENERLKNRLEVDPRHDYDGISTRDATVKVLDEQVDQLKAENERLAKTADCWDRLNVQNKALSDSFRAERDQAEQDYKDVVGTIELRDIEISKLRAEVAGLRTGYEAYERVNAELKAEVEGLRRERAGKILCDLELFETLRDSANTEADEHRQCMATYRPLRQASLDSVVKKCDDLLAALGKGEQS